MKGKYQHYKGGMYELLCVAKHSETQEELVVYQSLDNGGIWARPKAMFFEEVVVKGKSVPRFKYLGQSL